MPEPAEGTNIHIVWSKILTDQYLIFPQLKEKAQTLFPDFPTQSFHVHVNSLIARGYASTKPTASGIKGFRRHKKPIDNPIPYTPNKRKKKFQGSVPAQKTLVYLKKNVGKVLTSGGVQRKLGLKGSGIWDIMKAFERKGYLLSEKTGRTIIYTVLPEILDCTAPPSVEQRKAPKREITKAQVIQPAQEVEPPTFDVLNMPVGQLANKLMEMNNENIRLKQGIATIGQILMQLGLSLEE